MPSKPQPPEPEIVDPSSDKTKLDSTSPSGTDSEPIRQDETIEADTDRLDAEASVQKGLDLTPWLLRKTLSFNKL